MCMSSSTLISQAVVFATAMAAFSGTVILLAIKTHKSPSSLYSASSSSSSSSSSSPSSQFQPTPLPVLRPCLSSGEKKGEKKTKKRVRFAEDVINPTGNNEEFRRQKSSHENGVQSRKSSQNRGMPANRVALYNGILRDRVIHRFACSY